VPFVFFVVKSPFTGPGEGKGFVYHEDHEGHEEGNGVWLGQPAGVQQGFMIPCSLSP